MLCSHVVSRQFLRPAGVRLISSTATILPGPRGRRRKADLEEPLPTPRSRGDALSLESLISKEDATRASGVNDDGRPVGPARRRRKAASLEEAELVLSTKPLPAIIKSKDANSGSGEGEKVKRTRKRSTKPTSGPVQGAMKRQKESQIAPRISLLAPTTNHHDLASFLEHSRNINSNPDTAVYRGTHYEYTVIEFLKTYNFALQRTGRSNDLGIDLLGHWHLPKDPQELRVLVQCKASKPRPSMIRELEGAYVGAPSGWRGADVMALLIARDPATLGTRNALQRSRLPMGFAQITESGVLRQFMWNHVAQEARLTGMSVTSEYRETEDRSSQSVSKSNVENAISLQWMGKQWSASTNDSRPVV